jgi:hypothetical protein
MEVRPNGGGNRLGAVTLMVAQHPIASRVAGTAQRVEGKRADAERRLFFKLCAVVGAAAGSGLAARRCMAMHAPAVANAAAAAWQRRHI